MGEIREYPVKTREELGALLTYSREDIQVGNAYVIIVCATLIVKGHNFFPQSSTL